MMFFKSETWAMDVPQDLGRKLCDLLGALGVRHSNLNPEGEFCTVVVKLPKDKMLKLGKAFNIRPYRRS